MGRTVQLDLDVTRARAAVVMPRVLAFHAPDLALQRLVRGREPARFDRSTRAPLAVERGGRVVACDAEARACGIRPGVGLAQARTVCEELEVVVADEGADRTALESLAEALFVLAPAVEVVCPDTLLLDAGGAHLLARRAGDGELVLMHRVVALAADLGVRGRVAIASGRSTARALARHGGTAEPVPPEAGARALEELPIDALELDPALVERLLGLGVRRVGDLARFPPETLASRFGAAGLAAWRAARAEDPSPLAPHLPRRLPEERVEFDAPLETTEPLLFWIKRLCDRVASRLLGRGLGATRLAVELRLDPRGEERFEVALALPSNETSRWLLVLRERMSSLRLPCGVLEATLSVVEAAGTTAEQLVIGDRPEQLAALETVLARLAARLGDGALFSAAPVDRYRPEVAYAAGAFTRQRHRRRVDRRTKRGGAGQSSGSAAPSAAASPASGELVRPTRLLARPLPLLALGEGGRVTAIRAGAQTFRVLAFSPAERLAGEWWSDPFDRDYHRVHLEGLGECWVFRDAAEGRLWLHGFFD